jgi:hypothetical protein
MAGRECCGSEPAGWDHDGSPQASPLRPRPARGGGAETPRRSQSEEAAPPPQGWRPALAVSRYPSLAGLRLMRSLPIWTSPTARDGRSPSRRAGQRRGPDPAADVWARGRWQRCQGRVRTWRPCGPIVSSSRPGSGRRERPARGRHRGCPRPDRGGRPDQQGGGDTGACARGDAGRESAEQPTHRIPDGWFRGWQRFLRKPARRVARPTRQAARERSQEPGRRPGQARRPR